MKKKQQALQLGELKDESAIRVEGVVYEEAESTVWKRAAT